MEWNVGEWDIAMLVVNILINLLAISVIVFRLTTEGWTPNRVFVFGANMGIMIHLVWMYRSCIGLVRRTCGNSEVQQAVTSDLPAFAGWAFIAVFILPRLFRFS